MIPYRVKRGEKPQKAKAYVLLYYLAHPLLFFFFSTCVIAKLLVGRSMHTTLYQISVSLTQAEPEQLRTSRRRFGNFLAFAYAILMIYVKGVKRNSSQVRDVLPG